MGGFSAASPCNVPGIARQYYRSHCGCSFTRLDWVPALPPCAKPEMNSGHPLSSIINAQIAPAPSPATSNFSNSLPSHITPRLASQTSTSAAPSAAAGIAT